MVGGLVEQEQIGPGEQLAGQLDPAALFYLRSRGLDEPEARSALTRAFAGAVLAKVDEPILCTYVHDVLVRGLTRLLDEVVT
jgi:Fe-S cluster assembly protein SufD